MPLFVKDGKAVLYLHVPKTGGTSISNFLTANGFIAEFGIQPAKANFARYRQCSPHHMHAATLLSLLRPSKIDYVFMTVREPVGRFLSAYKMRVRTKPDMPGLEQWVDQVFRLYPEDPYVNDNHIRPQSEFWLPGADIFRQEDGYGDAVVTRIEEKLGMRFEKREIATNNADGGTKIEEASIARVAPRIRQFYRADYAMLEYE